MSYFKLQVQTPDEILVDQDVKLVTAVAMDGTLTILPGHESMVTRLEVSVLTLHDMDGKTDNYVVNGGMLSFKNNLLLINTIEAQKISRQATNTQVFQQALLARNEKVDEQIREALKLGGVYQPDMIASSLLAEERLAKIELLKQLLSNGGA